MVKYTAKVLASSINGYPQYRLPLSSKIAKKLNLQKGSTVEINIRIIKEDLTIKKS